MIRAWLNCRNHTDYFDYTYSGFYKNAFSYEERRAIATTTVVNESVGNADGGKTSTGVGPNSLKKVGKNSTDQWKFTVRDTYRNEFSISDVTVSGYAMLQMNYSGAAIDSRECPERISAIVVGSKGNIKYYGNIATPVYPGGTATLNPDGKFDQKAGDKLYVFNEQLGGDKKTDYSSELKEINVPALSSRPAKVSILTPKASRKKVTIRWKKASGGVYYQVGCRLKGSRTWRYTTSKTTYKTIKKLKGRKYYYVKVRAYKKVGKTTCYGVWSATRKEKLNKKTCTGQGYSTTLTSTFPGNF